MSEATIEKAAENGEIIHQPKAAYISAPSYLDTSALRKELAARGVEVFSPDELDLPGQNIVQIVREAMRRADLVVAVVDRMPDSSFVFYEIGFAQALDKPTFALLVGDSSPSSWLASGVPYFRFNPDNPVGLDFAVSQILTASHHCSTISPGAPRRTRPLGESVDQLLKRVRAAGDRLGEDELRSIVASAIRESGVTTVEEGSGTHNYLDLMVWSDDLSPWLGNPLAIELIPWLHNGAEITAKATQTMNAMARYGIRWGLLIYGSSSPKAAGVAPFLNVIPITVEQFLESLRDVSFGDLVRRLRNQRVHGGS